MIKICQFNKITSIDDTMTNILEGNTTKIPSRFTHSTKIFYTYAVFTGRHFHGL